MTNIVHDCFNDNSIFNTKKWVEYTDDVEEVLEKQFPKKPNEMTYRPLRDIGWKYGCPSCKCAVGINNNAIDYTQEDEYCPSCGQRLEW
jgi:rubrerythrin